MKRRAFLGFMGGAAAAGPSLVKAVADDTVLKQSGFPMGSEVAGAAPSIVESPTGAVSKFVRWVKRTGIPTWKMNDLRRQADYERRSGLDPDLAALVSVSAGFKARTQRQRNLDRVIERSLASVGRHGAQSAFSAKVREQFGDGLDWYD